MKREVFSCDIPFDIYIMNDMGGRRGEGAEGTFSSFADISEEPRDLGLHK